MRPLESDPGGHPGTNLKFTYNMPSYISKHISFYIKTSCINISLQWCLGAINYFWYKNLNPRPTKPIVSHTWRHIAWDLKSVPSWPPGSASSGLQVKYIILGTKIVIQTLTNLYLDIYDGIFCMTSKSGLQDQHTATSRYTILFLIQELKSWPSNLYLDIHEGILCVTSRIILQRPPGTIYYFWHKNWNPDPNKAIFRHTWRHIAHDLQFCTWLASRISLQWPPSGLILFLI